MSNLTASSGGTAGPVPLSKPVSFATAGLGGVLGWIVVHPFNTVAIRMNLAQMSAAASTPSVPNVKVPPSVSAKPPSPNFLRFTADIAKAEGPLTLYNGLSAGILRQVFYATSRFGLYEVFRDKLAEYRETDLWSRLAVGVVSGGCAAFVSCPAEVSLVRMSNDKALPVASRRNYSSVFDAAVRIAREEGLGAYWRGAAPFVNRAMLVGAMQVGTYDQFKVMYRGFGITSPLSNVFCASMTAGLLYSLITMPLETVKNRMAFQKADPTTGKLPYTSITQSLGKIARAEGVRALWEGFLPYYGRCGGHTVCMFIAVEQLRSAYRKYVLAS